MAIFHMGIRSIKRSAGQQATGAAAYRAGESIRDERTGDVHNHSRRKDVRHSEIVLPSKLDASNATWAQDRARLWNAAEAAEKRRDSRVAREYQVALPPELTPEQRLALARSFSRELADRYGVAVDLAIHDPKPGRESTNFHAHLLTTTREVTPTGLGAKTGLDMHGVARAQRGLASHSEEYSTLRERWAALTNHALREANVEARVDHRSLAAQGIDRKPLLHIPLEFYQLERNGMPKEAAERLRKDYRARLSAFRERSAAPKAAETAIAPAAVPPNAAASSAAAVPTNAAVSSAAAVPTAAAASSAAAVPTNAAASSAAAVPTNAAVSSAAAVPTAAAASSAAAVPTNAAASSAAAVPTNAAVSSAGAVPTNAAASGAAANPTNAAASSTAAAIATAAAASSAAVPTAAPTTAGAATAATSGTVLAGASRVVPGAAVPSIPLGDSAPATHTITATSSPSPSAAPTVAPALPPTAASSITAGATPPAAPAVAPRNSEEIRRRAVQAWLRMRSKEAESTNTPSNEAAVSRGPEEGRDR